MPTEGKRKIIEDKQGPVLLDVLTYRYSGHSPSDASSYRSQKKKWKHGKNRIALFGLASELVEAGVAKQDDTGYKMKTEISELIT